jgi:hypothetical protein
MSGQSAAEIAWRQDRLEKLTRVGGLPPAVAQGVVEREAFWRPWEFVAKRVSTLSNLDRYR